VPLRIATALFAAQQVQWPAQGLICPERVHMSLKGIVGFTVVSTLTIAASCQKKTPLPAASLPPAAVARPAESIPNPAATVREFTVEPSTIIQGQSATLRWQVEGANNVMIDTVGKVDGAGHRQVSPVSSTIYRLTASGPAGSKTATAVIRVIPPPPATSSVPSPTEVHTGLEERLSADLQDVYFDYGSSNLREENRQSLTQAAIALKAIAADFPKDVIVLEGHCDDRGSAEYNLALGDRRASTTKEFLVELGISPDRVTLISYGKEQPQCTDADESCWQRNRRVHFTSGR